MKKSKLLVVIAGPTAIGKTKLTIDLAKRFSSEIISADSRQVFRELEIGTAKPDASELAEAKHYFINTHSVHDPFSAGDFEREGLRLLATLFEHLDVVFMTGGSGMYIDAICKGLDEMPAIPINIRDHLMHRLRDEGLSVLQEELRTKDPEYFEEVDIQNSQRVVRALEMIEGTGQKFSSFRTQKKEVDRPFSILKVGLEMEREKLNERIDLRMDMMIEAGLFEEARTFHPLKHINALQTVGYREIFDFFDGIYDREEAVRLLKRNSRRYAKRQMTWFKRDSDYHWYHPQQREEIVQLIEQRVDAIREI